MSSKLPVNSKKFKMSEKEKKKLYLSIKNLEKVWDIEKFVTYLIQKNEGKTFFLQLKCLALKKLVFPS